jgi:hypothetical protein
LNTGCGLPIDLTINGLEILRPIFFFFDRKRKAVKEKKRDKAQENKASRKDRGVFN